MVCLMAFVVPHTGHHSLASPAFARCCALSVHARDWLAAFVEKARVYGLCGVAVE
jgi:hypothetical protein